MVPFVCMEFRRGASMVWRRGLLRRKWRPPPHSTCVYNWAFLTLSSLVSSRFLMACPLPSRPSDACLLTKKQGFVVCQRENCPPRIPVWTTRSQICCIGCGKIWVLVFTGERRGDYWLYLVILWKGDRVASSFPEDRA